MFYLYHKYSRVFEQTYFGVEVLWLCMTKDNKDQFFILGLITLLRDNDDK